ncbi:MAG TPA: hypothetical protein VGP76_16190 [Planctomycetaceae bacterium]|jgi:thiol-disulfide isomerase/thioredoxin|nr:hypothetical protein [Planctomycetaceae bacterium]
MRLGLTPLVLLAALGVEFVCRTPALGEDRAIIVLLFVRSTDAHAEDAKQALNDLAAAYQRQKGKRCLVARIKTVPDDPIAQAKLDEIGSYLGIANPQTPLVYSCRQAVVGYSDKTTFVAQIKGLLTARLVHGGDYCHACKDIPKLVAALATKYPGLIIKEVDQDTEEGSDEKQQLKKRYEVNGLLMQIPAYVVADKLLPYAPPAHPLAMQLFDETLSEWSVSNR